MSSRESSIAEIHRVHGLREETTWDVFNCAACKDIGFGNRYIRGCSDGTFQYFHKVCIDHEGSHPFYPDCQFEYKNKESKTKEIRNCAACGRPFEGERYKVYKKQKAIAELHPSCMMMTMTPSLPIANLLNNHTDDDIRSVILVLERKLPSPLSCIFCGQKDVHGETWAYVSNCKSFACHFFCLKDLIKRRFKNATRLPVTTVNSLRTADMNALFGSAVSNISLPSSSNGATKQRSLVVSSQGKAMKIAKALLSIVIAAIFGDPVTMAIALFTAFLS